MTKYFLMVSALLVSPLVLPGEQVITIFTEDFEGGLDAWSAEHKEYVDPEPDQMEVFPAGGSGIYGPLRDTYGVWNGSQCVGHTNLTWDGTPDHWIQKQWPGGLEPGTYTVTLEYDVYVYADVDHLAGGPWDVGSRVYLLADEDFDAPCFDFDNHADPPLEMPGFNIDFWPGYENYMRQYPAGRLPHRCRYHQWKRRGNLQH